MLDIILVLKFVHELGASVLFGTGIGTAFFMLLAHRSGHAGIVAVVTRFAGIADLIFVATAAALQPVSGVMLAWAIGLAPLQEPWIVLSLLFYAVIGLCWLPAALVRRRIRDLAQEAALRKEPLPEAHGRLFRLWFLLGLPAFAAVVGIFALMVWQPRFE